jgi:hypothetical protein
LGVNKEVTVDLAELERRLRVLEDIEAIMQLKYRYADACDRGYDSDTLANLFTVDAIWEGDLFGRYEGREAIRDSSVASLPTSPSQAIT